MRTTLSIVVLALPFLAPGAARAEDPAPVTPEVRAEVIDGLIELMEDIYVIPETADRIRDVLRKNLASGAYDVHGSPDAFAVAITEDMQELSGDKHLRLMFGEKLTPRLGRKLPPGAPGAMPGKPMQGEPKRVIVRGPAGAGEGGGPQRGEDGASDGGVFEGVKGIPEAKMLPGNVGYVDIRMFVARARAEEDAVAAMEAVAGADALIFDLRACMGGSPDMVHFITSYLYPPEPMHLLTYYHARSEPESMYTLEEVPGQRMPDTDVYLLISAFTGSGCEEFSYNLKHHGRATLIGEKTAGAGHGGGVHPVAAGFHAFVPDFRPVHPKTGGGWEGVGVVPTAECPSAKALPTAHMMALEEIRGRTADPARAAELDELIHQAAEEIARVDEPRAVDAAAMAEYAGSYGYRTISVEADGLYLQRTGGPKLKMVPADQPKEFMLELVPQAKIRFGRGDDGSVEELHVLGMEGRWEVTKRGE